MVITPHEVLECSFEIILLPFFLDLGCLVRITYFKPTNSL